MLCSHRLPNGSVSEMAELQPTRRMWLMPVRILWFAASGSVCEVPQQTQGTQKALLPALTPCSHTAWNFTSKQRGHPLKICHSLFQTLPGSSLLMTLSQSIIPFSRVFQHIILHSHTELQITAWPSFWPSSKPQLLPSVSSYLMGVEVKPTKATCSYCLPSLLRHTISPCVSPFVFVVDTATVWPLD